MYSAAPIMTLLNANPLSLYLSLSQVHCGEEVRFEGYNNVEASKEVEVAKLEESGFEQRSE